MSCLALTASSCEMASSCEIFTYYARHVILPYIVEQREYATKRVVWSPYELGVAVKDDLKPMISRRDYNFDKIYVTYFMEQRYSLLLSLLALHVNLGR